MHLSDYFSKIISFGFWLPAVQLCNWVGFRISLSLSREGAIFRDEIENYFSCSHLAKRDQDYHRTILVFRDDKEITYCYSRVSRRDRDFRKSFLVVERDKMKLTLVENSRDQEFSLNSDSNPKFHNLMIIYFYSKFIYLDWWQIYQKCPSNNSLCSPDSQLWLMGPNFWHRCISFTLNTAHFLRYYYPYYDYCWTHRAPASLGVPPSQIFFRPQKNCNIVNCNT